MGTDKNTGVGEAIFFRILRRFLSPSLIMCVLTADS